MWSHSNVAIYSTVAGLLAAIMSVAFTVTSSPYYRDFGASSISLPETLKLEHHNDAMKRRFLLIQGLYTFVAAVFNLVLLVGSATAMTIHALKMRNRRNVAAAPSDSQRDLSNIELRKYSA